VRWLTNEDIQAFLEPHDYDVRKSGNARWIDQKCAADVVTIVADCISQFSSQHPGDSFTTKDVWHADYTIQNVEAIFKKPGVVDSNAKNEYDKFFQQPMEMLAYAGVLRRKKDAGRNVYSVVNEDVLAYIALRERNALTFLQLYIQKVLKDSGLEPEFTKFFRLQTQNSYDYVKAAFENFTIKFTKINNVVECRRIFIKVINPLAYMHNAQGTESGRLSRHKITYDMLMYNRDNFRDITANKPKDLTRRQYAADLRLKPSAGFAAYTSQKAKRVVREFNEKYRAGVTEVLEPNHVGDRAVHIHHIFPEAGFTEICAYYENLIALTPTQHLSYAHPQGHTQKINEQYQHICLIAKAGSIEETLNDQNRDQIYEFGKFMYVLRVGFDDERFTEIPDRDFKQALTAINLAYAG
jgi:hypothetical protein